MNLSLDQLDLLATPAAASSGEPLQLPIDSIDEDPEQPRHEFDADSLAELGETIKERGVRQPISVRQHPEQPGRWMLNFGARRLRASRLMGKLDIPAFVDNTANSYDQVIENEQREGLKPLELALFVRRQMANGESQAEIARRLGKSRAYVTFASALIDAPAWMMAAYREGRCRGLRELYELRQVYERQGSQVQAWAAAQPRITRSELMALKAEADVDIDQTTKLGKTPTMTATSTTTMSDRSSQTLPMRNLSPITINPTATVATMLAGVVVEAQVEGHDVEVVLDRLPVDCSQMFVRNLGSLDEWPAPLACITPRRIARR